MIEINLVPDVKQEFIKAQRVRNTVISMSILVAIGCAAALVLVALYVFGAQGLRNLKADEAIDAGVKQLQSVPDLDKALTVQNQLQNISAIQDETQLDARLFDLFATVTPRGKNEVTISRFSMDAVEGTITVEGQSRFGYRALDAFKKTLLATKFKYTTKDSTDTTTVPLTEAVGDGDRSYGRDAEGNELIRFTITFSYAEKLFSRGAINAQIIGPQRTNATDSALQIPSSIFENTTQRGGD